MNSAQKTIQYLNEAHATERALTRALQAHISVTPRGAYRSDLERHLDETRSHVERLRRRLTELGESQGVVQAGVGALQSVLGQALAVGKGPFDAFRGASNEETLLKNAKDEFVAESLEIATYSSLEHFARAIGDETTARLAASIRGDEERMRSVLQERIYELVEDVIRSELKGEPVFDRAKTGAADSVRHAGESAKSATKEAAGKAGSQVRRTARQARKVPGVAQVEGELKGAVASEGDLAIADYDSLNAVEIVERLNSLSQIELARIDAYERRNENRSTVLSRIDSLRGEEPWPGYDELTVEEIKMTLARADADQNRRTHEYERRHKERSGVLETAEQLAGDAGAST